MVGMGDNLVIDPNPTTVVVSPITRRQAEQSLFECIEILDWFADSDDGFPFLADGELTRAPAIFK